MYPEVSQNVRGFILLIKPKEKCPFHHQHIKKVLHSWQVLQNYQTLYDVGMVKSPLAKFTREVRVGYDEGSLPRTTPCACLRDEAYRQTSARAREPGHSSQPHPTTNGPFRQKERRTFPLPSPIRTPAAATLFLLPPTHSFSFACGAQERS